MANFQVVIFLMAILIGLSAVADKIRLPYPILLVLVGLIIGFVPFLPDLAMDPDVVFLVFLPPLLYNAAAKTSWHEFRKSLRPISTLAITLVFFTTTAIAVAAHYYIPGFSWPLAFLLGAIVSPPDAVAAASITKGLGLSRRVTTILEGESLVNDASALIAYRYALVAVSTGSFVLWKAGLQFFWVAGGGILIGVLAGYCFVFIHKRINNNATVETSLTLLAPFVVYLAAERLHVSGVLAVVSTGLVMSWRAPEIFSSETRMRTRVVWDSIIFLLDGIVFILIGLQLPDIVKDIKGYSPGQVIGYGLIISAVAIVVRLVWVFTSAYWLNLFSIRRHKGNGGESTRRTNLPWRNVLIVGWTGTRGVLSLATAMALPLTLDNGSPFPYRHLILFIAFVVIFVTLVVQGLTLPPLIRLLGVKPRNDERKEEMELQLLMADCTLDYINHHLAVDIAPELKEQLTRRQLHAVARFKKGIEDLKNAPDNGDASAILPVHQIVSAQKEIIRFQRQLLLTLHHKGSFGDEAIRKMERELDIEDLRLHVQQEKGPV